MAKTTARPAAALLNAVAWLLVAALALLLAANLGFFAVHGAQMLAYPYPLDYGEGPLLAQVNGLRDGLSLARLYGDPAAAPYQVVNYPPVYHLVTLLLAALVGDTLLAGRLVALLSTFGALAALFALAAETKRHGDTETRRRTNLLVSWSPCLVLLFLALPIVREWSVVMRVDMLGVCLGLWGLVVVRRNVGRGALLWAAPLLLASLFTKPSLVAAPAAALLWLLLRDWRRAALLALALALGGGALAALLQRTSGGWFFVHVVQANANTWQRALATQFWRDQMLLHAPLVLAALLAGVRGQGSGVRRQRDMLLPALYTLFGVITAIGVGKVGAYANYFLEMYAGLVWLIARSCTQGVADVASDAPTPHPVTPSPPHHIIPSPLGGRAAGGRSNAGKRTRIARPLALLRPYILPPAHPFTRSPLHLVILSLTIAGLLRYYPTWSANDLKLAGILEPNPARVVVGGYGVWRDLARERDVLQTLGAVNAALVAEVGAANAPILTDSPGVAAQAGALTRLQAFEHRQLLDVGAWDQRPLLRDLANGRVPLIVLDYLGNWLTPQMIAVISHRYAQDGARGTYDLYRPVEAGARVEAKYPFPGGLVLAGYHLARSPEAQSYHPGEIIVVTLDATTDDRRPTTDDRRIEVALEVRDGTGKKLAESVQPLLYGALPPRDWADATMQHMQTITLPEALTPGRYTLALALRSGAGDAPPPQPLAQIAVEPGGRVLHNRSAAQPRTFFVPAPLLAAWAQTGGDALLGEPLTPAVPFGAYTAQCFARGCLRLLAGDRGQETGDRRQATGDRRQAMPLQPQNSKLKTQNSKLSRVALGEIVRLGETAAGARAPGELRGEFRAFWDAHGGAALLGEAISAEFVRGDSIVQYTRYARLERPTSGGTVRLARLGDEFLRLPPWVPYRWP